MSYALCTSWFILDLFSTGLGNAAGQIVNPNAGPQRLQFSPRGLANSVRDPTVAFIALGGNMTITDSTWGDLPINITRNLTIAPEFAMERWTLDFGGLQTLMYLENASTLAFENVHLTGIIARQHVDSDAFTRYRVDSLILWPVMVAQLDVQVVYTNVTLDYTPQDTTMTCTEFTARTVKLVSSQIIDPDAGPSRLKFHPRGLYNAVTDQEVGVVALGGNITITQRWWDNFPVNITRNLTITSDPAAEPITLDFGGLQTLVQVFNGSTLTFQNLHLTGVIARKHVKQDDFTRYRIEGLIMWPAVGAQPNAQIYVINVTLDYTQDTERSCREFTGKAAFAYQALWPDTRRTDTTTILIPGIREFPLNVTDSATNTRVGAIAMTTQNVNLACITDPYPNANAPVPAPAPAPAPVTQQSLGLGIP
ncbi:hypothetical protein WJX72_009877 [[Myrmecia] bisecta]|uniref:Uncharacterized protein n=1 Tax=[Myrmecia] bisecta TaxID=41462 RepID=A0AAW1QSF0_9CHLO